MPLCSDCEEIVQNQRGAPGHERLISLGYVRSLALAHAGGTHEAFVCSTCGAEWDYFDQKKGAIGGWTRT